MYKLLMLGAVLGIGFGAFKMIKNRNKSSEENQQPSNLQPQPSI